MSQSPETFPPAATDCRVIELRQYTLHPGQRDTLIELFDREFVESQEAVGMRVLGQFCDLDDPDRFVWLRGFADMAARGDALPAFYGGPVWAAHRGAANPTMIDSDNVLLLRPAWDGAALPAPAQPRAPRGATALPAGVLSVMTLHLQQPPEQQLLNVCRGPVARRLADAGARVLGWYATEHAANNFPRLPVREGEEVLLGLAMFDTVETLDVFAAGAWLRDVAPLLQPWLARPAEMLRLAPTARSALRG